MNDAINMGAAAPPRSSKSGPIGERAHPARARCALARPRTRRGRYFLLGTAGLCILGYEHNLAEPAIRLWNDTRHLDRA
jgi:hypothetical protein